MKSIFLAALFLAGSGADAPADGVAAGPRTGMEWVALCDTDAKACSDVLFDHIWERTHGPQTVGWCLPDAESSPQRVALKVAAWLKEHADEAEKSTPDALTAGMLASYPCGRR